MNSHDACEDGQMIEYCTLPCHCVSSKTVSNCFRFRTMCCYVVFCLYFRCASFIPCFKNGEQSNVLWSVKQTGQTLCMLFFHFYMIHVLISLLQLSYYRYSHCLGQGWHARLWIGMRSRKQVDHEMGPESNSEAKQWRGSHVGMCKIIHERKIHQICSILSRANW